MKPNRILGLICSIFLSSCAMPEISVSTESSSSQETSTSKTEESVSSSTSYSSEESSISTSSSSEEQTSSISSSEESSSSSSSSTEESSSSSSIPPESLDAPVTLDLYAFNDFHGNVLDSSNGLGITKTTTLLRNLTQGQEPLFLSQGDMWQGSMESNLTRGELVTRWMNQIGFSMMTVGNHEFDWTTSYIAQNAEIASFPILGINVIDVETQERASFCQPSTVVTSQGIKVGIIGAVGDCYSSISASMVRDVRFAVGEELTALVQEESHRLKYEEGCDFVVFSCHDSYQHYDTNLSQGEDKVDLVLEGHTHEDYREIDSYGVYHVQGYAQNGSFNHVAVSFNENREVTSVTAEGIYTSSYTDLEEDAETLSLLNEYAEEFASYYEPLGYNASYRSSRALRKTVSSLYLEHGLAKWGEDYDIVLGGGYLSCRSPSCLEVGDVTLAMLYTLFPFDNDLVLCSIPGEILDQWVRGVSSQSHNYFLSYSSYGDEVKTMVDITKNYYVVTDTYSSDYAPNQLTEIDRYSTSGYYARDMLGEYIAAGGYATES